MLEGRIILFLQSLYLYDILENYDKNRLYEALNNLVDLENEISFNRKLGYILNISNFLIKHKQFRLLILYSKILHLIRQSQSLLKIYSMVQQE